MPYKLKFNKLHNVAYFEKLENEHPHFAIIKL